MQGNKELSTSYNRIFKSTILFSVVQVINVLAKVGLNKAVALFIGAEGLGIIGLYFYLSCEKSILIIKNV